MHILLVLEKTTPLDAYRGKLTSWGITSEVFPNPVTPKWKNGDLDPVWLAEFCAMMYAKRAEAIDAVQFISSTWKIRGAVGRHYYRAYSGYRIGAIRIRTGMEKTALHELMHTFDDIVYIYTGISLSQIAKVTDWDEDVVHGRDPRFKEYEYDHPYNMVRLYVNTALQKRKRLGALNLMERLLIQYRALLMTKQAEEISEPEESTAEKLYKLARASLGTDASPSDLAPDELGCAETVSTLLREVLPTFPIVTGTWTLWDVLQRFPGFVRVQDGETLEPGDIIISPTGLGNGTFPGHAGIVGKGEAIMSNDSRTGKFDENYTIASWKTRYAHWGGFPVYIYRILN